MAEINYQNSKYIKSPKYSFSKARKFFYKKYYNENPGPGNYESESSFKISACKKSRQYSFGKGKRFYFKALNSNPGPGSYSSKSFLSKSKGFTFGKKNKFIDDNTFIENLFLPLNYS